MGPEFWSDVKLNSAKDYASTYNADAQRRAAEWSQRELTLCPPRLLSMQEDSERYLQALMEQQEGAKKRRKKEEDLAKLLQDLSDDTDRNSSIEVGGGVYLIDLFLRPKTVEIWLKDTLGALRHVKVDKGKLLSCTNIQSLVVEALRHDQ